MPRPHDKLIDLADIAQAPLPLAHLGGTARNTLAQEAEDALRELQIFRQAYNKVTTHQRDYYMQPDGGDKFEAAIAGRRLAYDCLYAIERSLLRRIHGEET